MGIGRVQDHLRVASDLKQAGGLCGIVSVMRQEILLRTVVHVGVNVSNVHAAALELVGDLLVRRRERLAGTAPRCAAAERCLATMRVMAKEAHNSTSHAPSLTVSIKLLSSSWTISARETAARRATATRRTLDARMSEAMRSDDSTT